MKIHVEVFIASRLLQQGKATFSTHEILDLVRSEFGDTRPGVTTYTHTHAVANSPKGAATVYNYLWRIDSGRYRCFDPNKDVPHPSRVDVATIPDIADVPDRYHHLLGPEAPIPLYDVARRVFPWDLVDQAFTVEAIMTPRRRLLTVDKESSTADREAILAKARERHFDVLPIERGGQIVGVLNTLTGHTEPLTTRWLISSDAKMLDVLRSLATLAPPVLFVLHAQEIVGLVAPADMNKLPARAYFYNIIGSLEMRLAEIARSCLVSPDDMLAELGEGRRGDVKALIQDAVASDMEVDPVEYLNLSDLINHIAKCVDCRAQLGLPSRNQADKSFSGLNDLRNSVMHPARSVIARHPGSLPQLTERLDRAREILHKGEEGS